MKRNKKIVLIVLAVLVVIGIIAAVVYSINYKNNMKTTETVTLSEFDNVEKIDESTNEILVATIDAQEENVEIPSINKSDEEKNKEEKKEESNKNISDNTYYIKVNIQANVVTVYKKDSNGNYTDAVKSMVCSTGSATPKSGTYATSNKYRWRALFGNVYGQYATKIVGHILFHSVPYLKQDPSSLEYWEYDKLGTAASAGCIRLTVRDAKWIYENCKSGTKVEFYSDSNPGPLGKPSAQKISGADESVRGWDPTDPNTNNPWKTYKPNKVETEKENTKKEEEPKKENNNIQNSTVEKNEIKQETTNNTVNNTTTNNTVNSNKEQTNTIKNNTVTNQITNTIKETNNKISSENKVENTI